MVWFLELPIVLLSDLEHPAIVGSSSLDKSTLELADGSIAHSILFCSSTATRNNLHGASNTITAGVTILGLRSGKSGIQYLQSLIQMSWILISDLIANEVGSKCMYPEVSYPEE